MDLTDPPRQMLAFMAALHAFYCDLLETWARTDVDALRIMDDWGSQRSLLISPAMWRTYFKPLYRDYVQIAHAAGKKFFMHSDGHILAIYPDLVEIGVDALNSQIFCMGVEQLAPFAPARSPSGARSTGSACWLSPRRTRSRRRWVRCTSISGGMAAASLNANSAPVRSLPTSNVSSRRGTDLPDNEGSKTRPRSLKARKGAQSRCQTFIRASSARSTEGKDFTRTWEQRMQPRERFIAALERRPITGLVPHFELVFFLTMEAFGKVHPSHRNYAQWGQMEEKERELHRDEMADIYIATAERYDHSAIFIHPNPDTVEETACTWST